MAVSFVTIQAITYALRAYEQCFSVQSHDGFTWFIGFYVTNWGQGKSSKRGRQKERARMEVSLFSCLLLNVHTDGHVCVFMCVRMHTRGPVKLLNTLYIFILGDESGASIWWVLDLAWSVWLWGEREGVMEGGRGWVTVIQPVASA